MTPQERHYARLGLAERSSQEPRCFDDTIRRAIVRPAPSARPGRIRFWIRIAVAGLALLVAAHIVAAKPLARARADIRAAAFPDLRAESQPPATNCIAILICEIPA